MRTIFELTRGRVIRPLPNIAKTAVTEGLPKIPAGVEQPTGLHLSRTAAEVRARLIPMAKRLSDEDIAKFATRIDSRGQTPVDTYISARRYDLLDAVLNVFSDRPVVQARILAGINSFAYERSLVKNPLVAKVLAPKVLELANPANGNIPLSLKKQLVYTFENQFTRDVNEQLNAVKHALSSRRSF